jgi:hypothetical protein
MGNRTAPRRRELTPFGGGVASLSDRERVPTPAEPERVAPASASRNGPVLSVRCTKDGAGNSAVLICDDLTGIPEIAWRHAKAAKVSLDGFCRCVVFAWRLCRFERCPNVAAPACHWPHRPSRHWCVANLSGQRSPMTDNMLPATMLFKPVSLSYRAGDTVQRARKEEGGRNRPTDVRRTGRDGKSYPATKAKRS